jgi:hypothetical protein
MHGVHCDGPCKRLYPPEVAAVFFRDYSRANNGRRRFYTCVGCEITARTLRASEDRWLEKGKSTTYRHAENFGLPTPEFRRRYQWDPPRIAHDLEHAYENTCPYCRLPYENMLVASGLSVITLDIVDPVAEPFYAVNVKVCCATCNTEKGKLTPEQWALKLRGWAIWRGDEPCDMAPALFDPDAY